MINKFTYAVLLVWAGIQFVHNDYQGSRRQAAMAWLSDFPARVKAWWPRLRKAHAYSKSAKHRRGVSRVSMQEKEPERYIGKRRAPRGYQPSSRVNVEPFLPPDPYAVVRRNVQLMINALEGSNEHLTPVLGRNQNAAGTHHRTAESMRTRQSGGGHRRHNGVYRRRGVQRSTLGLQTRIEALYDLVQEGLPEERKPGRHARPRLWRLSRFTRRGEFAPTL